MHELTVVKERVKKLIRQGETLKAATFLNDEKDQFTLEDQESSYRLFIHASNLKRDYVEGQIKQKKYLDEKPLIDHRILEFLTILQPKKTSREGPSSTEIPTVEPFNLTGPSTKQQGFRITINQKQHWLAFSTHYVEDRLYVNEELLLKKKNLFKYNNSYLFTISENDEVHRFELKVKFSIGWGTIKYMELVYDDKIILYNSKNEK